MTEFEERLARELAEHAAAAEPEGQLEDLLAMLPRRSHHPCPVRPCAATVPRRLLMCAPHWRLVPYQLQRAVWDAWNQGRGEGSTELLCAQAAAITFVIERTNPDA